VAVFKSGSMENVFDDVISAKRDMIEVLVNVLNSKELHPLLKDALAVSLKLLKLADMGYSAISLFKPNKPSTSTSILTSSPEKTMM